MDRQIQHISFGRDRHALIFIKPVNDQHEISFSFDCPAGFINELRAE